MGNFDASLTSHKLIDKLVKYVKYDPDCVLKHGAWHMLSYLDTWWKWQNPEETCYVTLHYWPRDSTCAFRRVIFPFVIVLLWECEPQGKCNVPGCLLTAVLYLLILIQVSSCFPAVSVIFISLSRSVRKHSVLSVKQVNGLKTTDPRFGLAYGGLY